MKFIKLMGVIKMTELANDFDNSEIQRVIEKIIGVTEGEKVQTCVSALTAVLSLVIVHHSTYSFESVVKLFEANYKSCVDNAKKEAH